MIDNGLRNDKLYLYIKHFNRILTLQVGMNWLEDPFHMGMLVSFKMGPFSDTENTHRAISYLSYS